MKVPAVPRHLARQGRPSQFVECPCLTLGISPQPEVVRGLVEKPVYGPSADATQVALEKLGLPGEYPFTRGVQATMYRGRFWTMRQYAGFGSAEESNRRYKTLLASGARGLSVAFDLPTQIGYAADDLHAAGEVGRVGVHIDTLADMEALFDGIPLGEVTTSMTINATAALLLLLNQVGADGRGLAPRRIGGTTQNDILKDYIARGTYIFPPRHSMRLVTDIFAYCGRHLPAWNTISSSG